MPSSVAQRYDRLKFCERMGWTFEQYDQTRAGDVLFAQKVWQMEMERRKK